MNVAGQVVPVVSVVEEEVANVVAQVVPAVSVAVQEVLEAIVAAQVEIVEVIVLTTKNHVATKAQ